MSMDFDAPGSGADDFMDSSFQDDPAPVPRPPRARSGRNGQLVVILAAAAALLLGAAVFLLLSPRGAGSLSTPGVSAPAGPTAAVDPGRALLLNELLVTADPGLTQKLLEVDLVRLDGAVVGYLPVMHQFQIRFNTDSRSALDDKKAALQAVPGVKRVDYNYLISLSDSPAEETPVSLPPLRDNALGLLGGLPPGGTAASGRFLLPSVSSSAEESGPAVWLESRRADVLPGFRAEQAASLLNQAGNQPFASCFFYEANQDGSLSGYTTSCALRFQLFRLVEAGAGTVAFPLTGPKTYSRDGLAEENELNALFFEALESVHPSFVLCKAWKKDDYLIEALSGTERGKAHLLTVSFFGGDPLAVLDAAGAGRSVFAAEPEAGGADLAAFGAGSETAVLSAAARLASARPETAETEPSVPKESLLASCGVLAADEAGTVLPALDSGIPAGGAGGPYRLLTLTARDSRTGQDIPGAAYAVESGAGTFREVSGSGRLTVLLPGGAFTVRAAADHYQEASVSAFPGEGCETVLFMKSTLPVGYVKGKLNLSGGLSGDLRVRFRNTETGAEGADMPLSADYRLEVPAGEYEITFTGRNLTSVTVYGVTVTAGAETDIPAVPLSELSDLPGTASGFVRDAMTGRPIENVELRLFEGVNAPDTGRPAATVSTGGSGSYSAGLPGGVYTARIKKDGYRPDTMLITFEGEKTLDKQDCTITPAIPEGTVRIVLEWGDEHQDLDSHLVNQSQGIHTWYRSKNASKNGTDVVTLDKDGLGPVAQDRSNRVETTTIRKQLSGRYVFYVHDFAYRTSSSSTEMARSGARVTVFVGSDETKYVFEVPQEPGTLWEVFSLENGVITPSGTVTYHSDDATVGR